MTREKPPRRFASRAFRLTQKDVEDIAVIRNHLLRDKPAAKAVHAVRFALSRSAEEIRKTARE